MEQIYADQGVPVRVETIKPGAFSSNLEYNAVLTGTRETSANASFDDNIDRIYYKVGDYIQKDSIVLSFPTNNPNARYFQAKVAYENAEATFKRMKDYYDSGGLSKQGFDNAKTSYEVAKADWKSVRQSVKVKAPIGGVLTRINYLESENVRKDDELFAITQINRLKARLWVADTEIIGFKKGQKATAHWNGTTLEGQVVQVDLSMNAEHQAFGVVAEFDNSGLKVRSGVTAKIGVATYLKDDAVVVARKNVANDGSSDYVFVANDGTAHKRAVQLGRKNGLDVEVTRGLQAGDVLITEGQLHLEDGTKIKIIDSEKSSLND